MKQRFDIPVFLILAAILVAPPFAFGGNLKKATFLPQWTHQAQFAGYYVAKEKGIYEKYGIDLVILPGGPDSPAAETLAKGKADFTSMFLATAIQKRASGVKLVNVGQLVQRSGFILVTRKSSGIASPEDMNGKRVSLWADFQVQALAFLRKYDLHVKIVPQTFTINLFLRGGVDVASAMWYNEYHTLLNAGLDEDELTTFFFDKYGLNFPEDGIYCLEETVKRDRELCSAFVQATIEGWKYAFAHPDESLDIVMKYVNEAHIGTNRVHQKWMLERMKDLISPQEAKTPMGLLREEDYDLVSRELKLQGMIKDITPFGNFMSSAPGKTKRKKLAFKISLFILAGTTCIFLAAFGYNYYYSRQLVLKNVEENARNLTLAAVNKIETSLSGVEKVPRYLASSLEHRAYSRDDLLQTIDDILNTNPDIFGAAVAFEPFAFRPDTRYFAPYKFRKKDGFGLHPPEQEFQYFLRDWYLIPKELERPIWSEPYFSEVGSNVIMATYSVPFYRVIKGERRFTGIVEVDVALEWLKDITSRITIYQSGYAFLVSQNGVLVTHPKKDWIMRESIFSIAEATGDSGLRKIGRDMVHGRSAFVQMQSHFTGKKSWIYYAPLPSIGWSIGVIFPEEELFASMKKLNWAVFIIGSAGFVLLFLVIVWTSRRITEPISALSLKTSDIARGNFDIELPSAKSDDEIGELTTSFENMRLALKEYTSNLRETTAAKERLESELKIAHTIQMSFLPKCFPFFTGKDEFELYATLEPAREVGGDLYDFFLVDEDHLFFSIGDVSDKGVPAALLMAVTKTLMKGIASQGIPPSEVLNLVNVELCQDNEAMMFCTAFCGVLNIRTGECLYSNAGHNPPLIVRLGRKPRWLAVPAGIPMGIDEDGTYKTERTILNPGDAIILYTDGVTEAMDSTKTLYTANRLINTVEVSPASSLESVVMGIINSVKDFAGGELQSDDITVMAVRLKERG